MHARALDRVRAFDRFQLAISVYILTRKDLLLVLRLHVGNQVHVTYVKLTRKYYKTEIVLSV